MQTFMAPLRMTCDHLRDPQSVSSVTLRPEFTFTYSNILVSALVAILG